MLFQIAVLMAFQLAGQAIVEGLGIGFPGPLCGMLLLLGWLHATGGPSEEFARVGTTVLDYLGLLFVPAGAALMNFGPLLLSDSLAIGAALVLSTGLAIFAGGIAGTLCGAAKPEGLH